MKPYQWAEWDLFASRIAGFIEWAEPVPQDLSEERYAIVREGAIAWARVSPNPEVSPLLSSGRFYDDVREHPEGAIEWARASAVLAKSRAANLLREKPPVS